MLSSGLPRRPAYLATGVMTPRNDKRISPRSLRLFIDTFTMTDPEDQNFIILNRVNDSVIPDSESAKPGVRPFQGGVGLR